jgi:hypothetical protein
MAKIKKPAAKKKTAAKKPAAKKPAAKKKSAAKKPAAKKPAAKKPAAKKKSAVKKPAAKKAAAKKPAAKKTVAKPVAKKPAAKPAVKKPVPAKPAAKDGDDGVKYRNLFDAFSQGKLPRDQGYIISSFFSETTAYSIYEIVSYAGVKEIFPTENGMQFVTGGKKLYVLVQNDTYHSKHLDPISRGQGESIPKRFTELEEYTARNQTRIYVAKEPNELFGSFTILRPSSINFSVVFYQLADVYSTISTFFTDSLNRQRKVPESDAKHAAKLITGIIEKTMSNKGEFA